MIDETLNPSVEKSTAENSVENSETLNVNPAENAPAAEETTAAGASAEAAGEIADAVASVAAETPVAAETEAETAVEEMRGAVISDEELKKLSSKSLKEIVETFRNLVENGDIMELNRQAEYIKATFYKVLKEEKIASGYHALPGSADYVEMPESETDAEPAPEAASVVNPMRSAASEEELQTELGIRIAAPSDASDKSFYIITNKVAQIDYTDTDGRSCTYRASAGEGQDISGIYYELRDEEELDIEGVSVRLGFADISEAETASAALLEWSMDGSSYSLWIEGCESRDEAAAAVSELIGLIN